MNGHEEDIETKSEQDIKRKNQNAATENENRQEMKRKGAKKKRDPIGSDRLHNKRFSSSIFDNRSH